MKNILKITALILLLTSCKHNVEKKVYLFQNANTDNITNFYSISVNDTFVVSICLPKGYDRNDIINYPVVYLLDANLYFDIIAVTYKKYAEIGLLPQVIIVGIGYKNLETMDSLRSRDFTYPDAIPEYEMSISGKADNFLSFIQDELIPEIDAKYSADKNKRILMGHSLGGYFTLFAMLQNLQHKNNLFYSYIAASPSTHYNHNYILNEFFKLKMDNYNKSKLYVTYGGLEDTEEEEDDTTMLKTEAVILSMTKSLKIKNKINFKGEIYSNLGHMDTPLPGFIKGLEWSLIKKE